MHELSIALSILDMVALEAIKKEAHEVKEIEIEVGRLAGVDVSALSFSLRAAQRYSPFENARISIVEIAPLSRCKKCQKEYVPKQSYGACPYCCSFDTELMHGRELRLKSILVE